MARRVNSSAQKARNWCFTLNNYTKEELLQWRENIFQEVIKYIIFGREEGKEGTPHLQGYIELNGARGIAFLKKIDPRAHWELRLGSQEQAIQYCQKEGHFEEFGEKKATQDERKENLLQNQLKKLADEIKSGKKKPEIYENYPVAAAKFPRYINDLISFKAPPRNPHRIVSIHYGVPGSGKTEYVRKQSPECYEIPIGSSRSGSLWFDGYYGQEEVLIDDFSGKISLDSLLRLLHNWPAQVEIKGGHTWWNPKKVFITTNVDWREWYNYDSRKDSKEALRRRVDSFWLHEKKLDKYTAIECNSDWEPKELSIFNLTPKSNPINKAKEFDVTGQPEDNVILID